MDYLDFATMARSGAAADAGDADATEAGAIQYGPVGWADLSLTQRLEVNFEIGHGSTQY